MDDVQNGRRKRVKERMNYNDKGNWGWEDNLSRFLPIKGVDKGREKFHKEKKGMKNDIKFEFIIIFYSIFEWKIYLIYSTIIPLLP